MSHGTISCSSWSDVFVDSADNAVIRAVQGWQELRSIAKVTEDCLQTFIGTVLAMHEVINARDLVSEYGTV